MSIVFNPATDNITLVGMSGCGKTRWSKRFEKELGFTRICVDDEIEKRLGSELVNDGYCGIADVAKWMGFPFEPQYALNSETYLGYERQIMLDIIERLQGGETGLVVDTTGSFIYTGDDVLQAMKALTSVVVIDPSLEKTEEMYQKFLQERKPVYFGQAWQPGKSEEKMSALARCYHDLLLYRKDANYAVAKYVVSHEDLRQKIDVFLNAVNLKGD